MHVKDRNSAQTDEKVSLSANCRCGRILLYLFSAVWFCP